MKHAITLNVNGTAHAIEVESRRLLLDCLRDDLEITGPKEGCSMGVCGACTVLVDGRLTSACLELAVRCDGARITTVEGLSDGDTLHPIQQAFIDHGGFQCGICTPGMLMTALELLRENPNPSRGEIREALTGNLCRCTGYQTIVDSIEAAARAMRGASS